MLFVTLCKNIAGSASVLPGSGVWLTCGKIVEKPDSLTMPLNWVIVAGFQNIDESEPPAATPANEVPCPYVLCSRIAKAPALACAVAMIRIPSAVPARSIPTRRDIDWPPPDSCPTGL